MATGWNSSDATGGPTVSGTGNTTVSFPGSGSIRGANGHSSGKWYCEFSVTGTIDAAGPQFGWTTLAFNMFSSPGQDGDSIAIFPGDPPQEIMTANVFRNSGFPGTAISAGDVVSCCADLDNNQYWFLTPQMITSFGATAWNGLSTANPASNVGGIPITLSAAAYLITRTDAAGTVVQLNSGQASFLRTAPSGFSAWDNFATTQQAQAFLSGAGSFAATARIRTNATAAMAGAGSFTASPAQIQLARAAAAGFGSFFYAFNAAVLVSASLSQDAGTGTLAGQTASLAGSSASADSAVGGLTLPTIAANAQQSQNALVDALLRGQPLLSPTTWYIALVTQLGDTQTPGLEVTGAGYARVAVPATLANWSGTQGPGSTVASIGTSGAITNNIAITFGAPSANWGTVIGYEFWDQATSGNRWFSGKLLSGLTINSGSGARAFAPGALRIGIG